MSDLKGASRELQSILRAGLMAADPEQAVARAVYREGNSLFVQDREYRLKDFKEIIILAAGKSAIRMTQAVMKLLADRCQSGLVVVPHGLTGSVGSLRLLTANHPVPDRQGIVAASHLLKLAQGAQAEDLVIILISGGASSLLPAPETGIRLEDKRRVTDSLLKSGARINEMNTVRKHLSRIKGGRLAEAIHPASFFTLIQSDVLTGDLSVIGSGLTSPDVTTFEDAISVLSRYRIWDRAPKGIRDYLRKGVLGKVPETPKDGNVVFEKGQSLIVSNNQQTVEAAIEQARTIGYQGLVLSTTLEGEAREVAKVFGAMAREIHKYSQPFSRPACILAGGELTVTVKGKGRGGRAQEFALSAAREISGLPDTMIIGFGTDGRDGSTPVAGAVSDGSTVDRARLMGMDPTQYLLKNDSYTFFEGLGDVIVTGPTGTNVNDLYLLLMP